MVGKLIIIEGIDGSGKATQTKLLVEKLQSLNQPAKTLDFPQYTQNFFGAQVRRYLNGEFGPATEVNPYLASVLYAADRWESSAKIKDWLSGGQTVILDRYYISNLIHQASKLSAAETDKFIAWDEKMELEVFNIPKPDLVIFLHLAAAVAHDWIAKRGEGHDGLDTLEHMKKSEEQSLKLAAKLGWQVIDANQPIEKVHEDIWQAVKDTIDVK